MKVSEKNIIFVCWVVFVGWGSESEISLASSFVALLGFLYFSGKHERFGFRPDNR
jgi:hypothetical protein